ncbi:hypothetical protein LB505_012599 [Fusarium chuoi]|nr:hypothetical protein LB505_012599 [Fusarium chuoi]
MSNLTRITVNFAVGSAQKDSIAQTCFNDMSWLMLERWINLMAQDEQIVLHKPARLAYEPKQSCDDVGDVRPVSSMFEDVDLSWFDSGLLDLTAGTFGDMISFNASIPAHDKTSENQDSTLTNNHSLGPSFSNRSEAYRRCAWTSWNPSRYQHSFHGQDIINLGTGSRRERTTLLMKASTGRIICSTLDDACRDSLLVLVTAMKISHFSIHSIPPAELLNDLVRFFFI